MKRILALEELSLFAAGTTLFFSLGVAWWWYPVLLFAPDLSMLGYLGGPRVGALCYNVVHHKALGLGLGSLAWGLSGAFPQVSLVLAVAGTILFTHSSMDRVLGYGLKFADSFTHTHLEHLKTNVKTAP